MIEEIELTEGQQQALEQFQEWLELPASESQFWSLVGYAGTGKTTLLKEFVELACQEMLKVAVTAPTNKAVRVLREKIDISVHFATIHSLLSIRAVQDGEQEFFDQVPSAKSKQIGDFELVIIDEASMISSADTDGDPTFIINTRYETLHSILLRSVKGRNIKVVFCGDSAQLQPVGQDDISSTLMYEGATLTEIVRHGDTIAEQSMLVRASTEFVNIHSLLKPPVIRTVKEKEIDELFENWSREPDKVRLLTWTNDSVARWNKYLRDRDKKKPKSAIIKGDRLIANSPCMYNDRVILQNRDECHVLDVTETSKSFKIQAMVDGDTKPIHLEVIKEEAKAGWYQDLDRMAKEARIDGRKWRAFWWERKRYHDLSHCYALTIHNSQGSTYDRVIVDSRDVYRNKDNQNRNQLLYVAMTRASKEVLIIV